MFKTILSKLIAVFIAIILLSFSVTGVMLFYFLENFVYDEKEQLLIQNAYAVDNTFTSINLILADNSGIVVREYAKDYLQREIEFCQNRTGSIIWVVDKEGEIKFGAPSRYSKALIDKLTGDSGTLRLPDKRQYEKAMLSGQEIIKEKGDFYGLFSGKSYLIIEKPMKYKDQSGNETTVAAVLLCLPMPEVHKLQWDIFKFFLISGAVSMVLAAGLAYVFSRRITKPLKEINNAARVIASGEFEKRLNITTRDEIGELANSFNNMVAALQNLEEMRSSFIANVSHELRTPMTSIRGFIEGIIDGTIPQDRQKYYLSIVQDEVNRMNRLVNNLLDLARMEAGELKLNMAEFNINELVRRVIIKLESMILQKNISIEAEFEEDEMYVIADVDSIERVVLNLIHNAIKFTPRDGKIILRTSYHKGKITVAVEDNGIGISKDDINMIWDRFYKTDKSRGQDKSGTGLGLAIVKNIISEHGQEIWAESEPGKGTKFVFTLKKPERRSL